MAKGRISNKYEAARNQQVELNKKKFQDLGILKTSKSLAALSNSEKKSKQHSPKPKSKTTYVSEPRRSTRARNPVPSYRDDVGIDLPPLRKRSRVSNSWGSYLARPLDEVREASQEERDRAFEAALELQSKLDAGSPSFVKSMVRSHVYSCFWLGLPSKFCEDHLPKTLLDMVLVDENSVEFEATYIGKRSGLSGGWRAFALDHKLDDGDALVFELFEPTRFKIYIVKAFPVSVQEQSEDTMNKEGISAAQTTSKTGTKRDLQPNRTQTSRKAVVNANNELAHLQKLQPESETNSEDKSRDENLLKKNGFGSQRIQKKGKSAGSSEIKKHEIVENTDRCASGRTRKKPAPKLLRKKVY
ncbi:putative B3 domain-containing protein At5g58280 [Juglans microcarpa x Juglans regia]|uniref:putative B3 domain-containing protein At5g58280 n=1 Tax=Juglans microcarpa x Juglans regia TaxID=2249226 RepID=UPI001B7E2566|nr:putative B3 domain-containing protein At5g58280 [Juglans microcarpa x Juglans regia]XP_040993813.1 putative B3 domain-containing protein At5g58280 [Juglans microcarpa x Juglans regia]